MTTKYTEKDIYYKTKNCLYFVGFLAILLIGQLIVWYQLMNTGFYATLMLLMPSSIYLPQSMASI